MNDPFEKAISILTRSGDFRVWSVIVTIFGDLAQDQGDRISGAQLSRLTELMAIKPEAMRVALHRLRKDGWIVSKKSGRSSNYRLTDTAFGEGLAARNRFYTRQVQMPSDYHVLVMEPMSQADRAVAENGLAKDGYIDIAPGVYLGWGAKNPAQTGFFTLQGDVIEIPQWLKQSNAPENLASGYQTLTEMLTDLKALFAETPDLTPLQIATLRVLVIHHWRRLLLRHADLPAEFYPDDWQGQTCRILVADILDTLPRPALSSFEETVG